MKVLQEGEFDRLGGTKSIQVDVRVIAATNKDLNKEIRKGAFREDLYYRLNVFPIVVPPLRDRKEDISPLLSYFVRKYSAKFKKSDVQISMSSVEVLKEYGWPGNVRELENLVERALIISKDGELPFAQLIGVFKSDNVHHSENELSLNAIERAHILKVLENCNWKINGRNGAAEQLELTPSTLRDRMKKHGISRPSQ